MNFDFQDTIQTDHAELPEVDETKYGPDSSYILSRLAIIASGVAFLVWLFF